MSRCPATPRPSNLSARRSSNDTSVVRDEFVHASEDPAPDALLGDLGKPALHLIEPGTAGRGEVQVIARVFFKPGCDFWRFVGGVIVQDRMHREFCGHSALDLVQEADKLPLAVAG